MNGSAYRNTVESVSKETAAKRIAVVHTEVYLPLQVSVSAGEIEAKNDEGTALVHKGKLWPYMTCLEQTFLQQSRLVCLCFYSWQVCCCVMVCPCCAVQTVVASASSLKSSRAEQTLALAIEFCVDSCITVLV
jgi:hypothetical protein